MSMYRSVFLHKNVRISITYFTLVWSACHQNASVAISSLLFLINYEPSSLDVTRKRRQVMCTHILSKILSAYSLCLVNIDRHCFQRCTSVATMTPLSIPAILIATLSPCHYTWWNLKTDRRQFCYQYNYWCINESDSSYAF